MQQIPVNKIQEKSSILQREITKLIMKCAKENLDDSGMIPRETKAVICSALNFVVARTLIGLFKNTERNDALILFAEQCKSHPFWDEEQ
jgi:hypothetical protein